MGVSIDLIKFDFDKLVTEIMTTKNITNRETLEKILISFGEKIDNVYIILNNEYYEDYNSYYELTHFIDEYFNVEDSSDCIYSKNVGLTYCNCNKNKYEVAEELRLKNYR